MFQSPICSTSIMWQVVACSQPGDHRKPTSGGFAKHLRYRLPPCPPRGAPLADFCIDHRPVLSRLGTPAPLRLKPYVQIRGIRPGASRVRPASIKFPFASRPVRRYSTPMLKKILCSLTLALLAATVASAADDKREDGLYA